MPRRTSYDKNARRQSQRIWIPRLFSSSPASSTRITTDRYNDNSSSNDDDGIGAHNSNNKNNNKTRNSKSSSGTTTAMNKKKSIDKDTLKIRGQQVNDLVTIVRNELVDNSNKGYQKWITNYMKDTIPYIGCKAPIIEQTVKNVMKECGYSLPKTARKKKTMTKKKTETAATKKRKLEDDKNDKVEEGVEEQQDILQNLDVIIDTGFTLLKEPEGDVKIAGMVLLSEYLPLTTSSHAAQLILERLEDEIFIPTTTTEGGCYDGSGVYVNEWATSDALSMRILKKIALQSENLELTYRILDYSTTGKTIWHRRCGLIPFLTYRNHLSDTLPNDFSIKLVNSIEESMQLSPDERFTQTACAWLLRYIILEENQEHCDYALQMIIRNRALWTGEAKRSIVKRLETVDPRRKQILGM